MAVDRVRLMINDAFKVFPPHRTIINENLNQKEVKIKYNNWNKIEKLLFIFEKELKIYLDRHGLANPDVEGGDMF